MKRYLFTLIMTGLILACANLSSQAVVNQQGERGYITISTSADKEIIPDVADISFSVKTYDSKSMQKASLSNKEISDKVYAILKNYINVSNGDYIKTSDYHAAPLYTYSNNKRVFDKYEVSNRIIVHTKSLDKLGTMIDKTIEAGATNIDSLKFSISDYEGHCNALIETATRKAKTRASVAVKGLASTLDGIRSMDVNCSDNSYSSPRVYMTKGMLGANSADNMSESSTNISSGTIKIYANVNASFYVK